MFNMCGIYHEIHTTNWNSSNSNACGKSNVFSFEFVKGNVLRTKHKTKLLQAYWRNRKTPKPRPLLDVLWIFTPTPYLLTYESIVRILFFCNLETARQNTRLVSSILLATILEEVAG